jgi:hypothetical protein
MLVLRSIAIGVLAAIALAVLSFGAASLFHLDAVGLYIAPANLVLPLLRGILPSGWAYAVVPSGGPAAGVLLILVSAILPWTLFFGAIYFARLRQDASEQGRKPTTRDNVHQPLLRLVPTFPVTAFIRT